MSGLKRVVAHWTVGTYKANSVDRKHYHFIIEGDGNVVDGNHKPEANVRPVSGRYAPHVRSANTGSIGISMASMRGAQSETNLGAYPFTETQFNAMCKKIAELCKRYDIAVSPMTVLSHAEVEPTLGIKQRGKWDFTVIPFMPKLRGHRACGNEMRRRVKAYLHGAEIGHDDGPSSEGHKRTRWLQRLLAGQGYQLGVPDGVVNTKTEAAIVKFQRDNSLTVTGEFDTPTVTLLRSLSEPSTPDAQTPASTKPMTGIVAALGALIAAIAAALGGDAADIISRLGG